ncbi:MAG: glycosyltransferase, partial [Planctomycetes bacterium]|nr:glycosyltransferase [Planctomycetota bacterium]
MLSNRTIFVTVPCYNEETQIGKVVETMPAFVDKIVIVDDVSRDRTVGVVKELARLDSRVVLIEHKVNGGVGKAIATGYIYCRDAGADVT